MRSKPFIVQLAATTTFTPPSMEWLKYLLKRDVLHVESYDRNCGSSQLFVRRNISGIIMLLRKALAT